MQVPIHAVYQRPLEEFIPRQQAEATKTSSEEYASLKRVEKKSRKGILKTIQIMGVFIALSVASIAVLGSGFFDAYVLSSSQVRIITGTLLYNK